MKNKLNDNLIMKIVAIFIAVILWAYVQIVQNPDIEYTFSNMEINLMNSSLLEEKKLTVINDMEDFKSDITVKCPRWNLNSLKDEDFVVYVDLSEINTPGESVLPVKVRMNNENIVVSNKSPSSIKLNIDRIVTREKPLTLHMSGNVKDEYYVNEKMLSSDITSVSIKGPESIVDRVYSAIASVNVNNKDESFSDYCKVVLADKDGTAVNSDKLTILNEKINVDVTVYKKKILPIKITNIQGIEYEIKPSSIEVAGEKEKIDNIEEIVIDNFYFKHIYNGYSQELKIDIDDEFIILSDIIPNVIIKDKTTGE